MALRAARDPSGRVRRTWQKRFMVDRVRLPAAGETLADEFDILLPCGDCTISPTEVTIDWDISVVTVMDTKQSLAYLAGQTGNPEVAFAPYRCMLHEARLMDFIGFLGEGTVETVNEWRRDFGAPDTANQCSAMVYRLRGSYTSAFTQPLSLRSTPQVRFTSSVANVNAPAGYGTQKTGSQALAARTTGTVSITAIV